MSSNLRTLCDALKRLTYSEMFDFADILTRRLAPQAPPTDTARVLSQIAHEGVGIEDQIAHQEQAQLVKLFKRKRQIVVTSLPHGGYEVKVPSVGGVSVVHSDLKQALTQAVDAVVALKGMQR